jgi:hypothetical protein
MLTDDVIAAILDALDALDRPVVRHDLEELAWTASRQRQYVCADSPERYE